MEAPEIRATMASARRRLLARSPRRLERSEFATLTAYVRNGVWATPAAHSRRGGRGAGQVGRGAGAQFSRADRQKVLLAIKNMGGESEAA